MGLEQEAGYLSLSFVVTLFDCVVSRAVGWTCPCALVIVCHPDVTLCD